MVTVVSQVRVSVTKKRREGSILLHNKSVPILGGQVVPKPAIMGTITIKQEQEFTLTRGVGFSESNMNQNWKLFLEKDGATTIRELICRVYVFIDENLYKCEQ